MISIIAAIGKNRELGKDNRLLWDIPEDLKRFRQLTSGHPIIMGRKTFESIGRVLPNRLNVVITRDRKQFLQMANSKWQIDSNNFKVVESLDEALRQAQGKPGDDEIFIIGGGQIFEQALPITDRLYLTIVDKKFDADTFFPDYKDFKVVGDTENGESGEYKYQYLTFER